MCKIKTVIIVTMLAISRATETLDFLSHYQTFDARLEDITQTAGYVKRSAVKPGVTNTAQSSYSYRFKQFDQQFDVVLDEPGPFTPDTVLAIHDKRGVYKETKLNTDTYYRGRLRDDPDSRVHGKVLEDGSFDGFIFSTKYNNSYYVEPTSRYPTLKTSKSQIIYRFADLNFTQYPPISKMARGASVPRDTQSTTSDYRKRKYHTNNKAGMYKRRVNEDGITIEKLVDVDRLPSRHCSIHIYVDHRFFEIVGKKNTAVTIDEVVHHLMQADTIFRSTSFDGQGSNNIGFVIARITLYMSAKQNPMSDIENGADSQEYLTKFSKITTGSYCLSFAFTVVDFRSGVLGLAWVAGSPRGEAGICAGQNTDISGANISYNSAIATYMNYQKLIPRPMFSITVTHEFGHNFGAQHDNASKYACAPGGADGNYVMFHLSGDGLKPNHFEFSSCSINEMYRILSFRIPKCFKEHFVTFCSNAIIDSESEDCDCGSESTCASIDPCCNIFSANVSTQCKLKSTSKCSAMASSCCSAKTCDLIPSSEREVCSLSSDCSEVSYCNGLGTDCPTVPNLPDGTLCYQNLKVCVGGTCAQTVCKFHGHKDCYCSESNNNCKVCCQHNTTGECKPATEWGFEAGFNGAIPVNGLCKDGNGICDTTGLCIFLDGSYDSADLTRLAKESAENALVLLGNYWYYAVLAVSAVSSVVGLFVYIHRTRKPVHSLAYKDGRMAYVWFEARNTLSHIEEEITMLDKYDPPSMLPYPIAARRIAYQFPTAPQSLYSRYLLQCQREQEVVKLLLVQGYPMRKLLTDDAEEREEQLALEQTLASMHE